MKGTKHNLKELQTRIIPITNSAMTYSITGENYRPSNPSSLRTQTLFPVVLKQSLDPIFTTLLITAYNFLGNSLTHKYIDDVVIPGTFKKEKLHEAFAATTQKQFFNLLI